MPNESRVLSFAHAELVEAISDYYGQLKGGMAAVPIKELTVSDDAGFRLALKFDSTAPPVSLSESAVAVALILFCNKKGIPIARRAVKSLKVHQGTVLLDMTICE